MSMQYRGDIQVLESDPEAHRAVMHTRARETRGQGTADANVEMRLDGDESRTHGTIETDMKLSGRAAAMGGGVIKDVSARIVNTFAQNLATMLAGDTEAPAAGPVDKQPSVAASPNGEPAPAQAAAAQAPPRTGAGEPTAASPAPSPAPQAPSGGRSAPAPDEDASLPALSILGSVIAGRLRNPRVLGAALGVAAVVVFLLRRRSR